MGVIASTARGADFTVLLFIFCETMRGPLSHSHVVNYENLLAATFAAGPPLAPDWYLNRDYSLSGCGCGTGQAADRAEVAVIRPRAVEIADRQRRATVKGQASIESAFGLKAGGKPVTPSPARLRARCGLIPSTCSAASAVLILPATLRAAAAQECGNSQSIL